MSSSTASSVCSRRPRSPRLPVVQLVQLTRSSSSTRYWPSTISRAITLELPLAGARPDLGASFSSSASTAVRPRSRQLAVELGLVACREVLERPGRDQLVDRRRACLHLLGLVARPPIASRCRPSARRSPSRLADPHLRSAAEYGALMTSFCDRKASIFAPSCFSDAASFCCFWSSCRSARRGLELLLSERLALQRGAREIPPPAAKASRACESA